MLHSLQHPCIVPLVGISIHPLCLALQLAPLGSLNIVLQEKLKSTGMRTKLWLWLFLPGFCPLSILRIFFLPAGSEYMPLGHMLTFKVAYQIAVGLAYLHRKNIIFCDLKSDNILVWSLQVCTGTTTKNGLLAASTVFTRTRVVF